MQQSMMITGKGSTSSKPAIYKAQWRAMKKGQCLMLARSITSIFPHKHRKVLKASSLGCTNKYYGGREASHNFPAAAEAGVGHLTVGFKYDTDQKVDTYGRPNGRITCLLSISCQDYIDAVKKSFCCFVSYKSDGRCTLYTSC
jgi:hypothetical protein